MNFEEKKVLAGKKAKHCAILFLVISFFWGITAVALAGDMDPAMQKCLIKEMQEADDTTTMAELKAACKEELAKAEKAAEQAMSVAEVEETALEKRIVDEGSSIKNLWTIMPHRPNYILLGNYNFSSMNEQPWEEYAGTDVDLNKTEVKFQISFKFMLWEKLFDKRSNGDLFFAYTQIAMWQLYNKDI